MGIRTVWANMTNAAQPWTTTTRLRDTESDQCEIDRKQRGNEFTKWVKHDFPVFLIRKWERHGGNSTTSETLFGYLWMLFDCIVIASKVFVRSWYDLVSDWFCDSTKSAELPRLSECGQAGDGLAIERPSGIVTTREGCLLYTSPSP